MNTPGGHNLAPDFQSGLAPSPTGRFDDLILLLDCDGVITDEYAVVSRQVIESLLALAGQGARLAFISGRSYAWFERALLPLMPQQDAAGLFFAAEMGALTSHDSGEAPRFSPGWSTQHERKWTLHVTQSIDPGFRSMLRGLFEASGLDQHLEWDETKQVGLTVEARHDHPIDETRAALSAWVEIAARQAAEWDYDCQRSVYAVDVVPRGQTKALGARLALDHFGADGRSRVLALGDSLGDTAIAETALLHGVGDVRFAWLGEGPAPVMGGVSVEVAPERFWPGTMTLLSRIEKVGL